MISSDNVASVPHESPYGYELVLDMHGCDPDRFTRDSIDAFFSGLCKEIEMEKCDVHFWDDIGVLEEYRQTLPHTKGTSAVCFILTSSIVVHTLDLLGAVYINVFSCKPFAPEGVEKFATRWFHAVSCRHTFLERR